ncbi:MAG TPA: hypothetical protein VFJ02_15090 [Vicinamibacterales bacterium]|nr:hypothetical protein [Vicinamibacterales bacterium]
MADKRHDDGTTGLGQELPADVQDRPEQNAGYDAAAADDADDAFEDEDDELEDEDDSEEEDEEEA